MKKSINVLSALASLFVCLIAQPAVAASDQTGTIWYEKVPIQIRIGEIGKDDKGNTTVQVFMDFEVLMQNFAPDAALQVASQTVRTKIVAQNKTFEASAFSARAGGLR